MNNTATKTYLVGVIERAMAYYEVEAEDARPAAENWQDGEFATVTTGPGIARPVQRPRATTGRHMAANRAIRMGWRIAGGGRHRAAIARRLPDGR